MGFSLDGRFAFDPRSRKRPSQLALGLVRVHLVDRTSLHLIDCPSNLPDSVDVMDVMPFAPQTDYLPKLGQGDDKDEARQPHKKTSEKSVPIDLLEVLHY